MARGITGTMSHRPAVLLILLGLACIERPVSPRDRYQVDRSELTDVLLASEPRVTARINGTFDEAIELIGLEMDPVTPSPGVRVRVTFYYRVLAELGDDWRIFVHIEDPRRRAARDTVDHWPAGGRLRTLAWEEGDLIRDEFEFVAGTAGPVEMWTGFYRGAQRMRVSAAGRGRTDGQDRLRVARFEVR